MSSLKYVYGPVPSRRLGRSLGISPLPKKTCNYACTYCQLGRTQPLTVKRKDFYPVSEILKELQNVLEHSEAPFDVITIVGEGEPTLYESLEVLIDGIKGLTDKPIAVITNGALLSDTKVVAALLKADFVLPSLDAVSTAQFKRINRPHGSIKYSEVLDSLVAFSKIYTGQLWLEIMFVKGINDDHQTLEASACLGGTAIDCLLSTGFYSEIADDYEALLSIIQRHPMNQFEMIEFLESRNSKSIEALLARLNGDSKVSCIYYKGYNTYRIKV